MYRLYLFYTQQQIFYNGSTPEYLWQPRTKPLAPVECMNMVRNGCRTYIIIDIKQVHTSVLAFLVSRNEGVCLCRLCCVLLSVFAGLCTWISVCLCGWFCVVLVLFDVGISFVREQVKVSVYAEIVDGDEWFDYLSSATVFSADQYAGP